ncbi:MAG: PEP-CTERM sorting domain-containing protein [Phycisphaera sp.]|nr:PEP-CTERM sorting domain-containing protein [Phycisphaera sp.]
MSVSTPRLNRYTSLATLPGVAVAGGLAAVAGTAEAEIAYQATAFTLGGPGPAPFSGTLDMGFATIGFVAGSNSKGPGALFTAKGNSNLAVIGYKQQGVGKSKSDNFLINFQAGELIPQGGSKFLAEGRGVFSNIGATKKGGSVSTSEGEWALGGAASVSGYMGFAFFDDGLGEELQPNYGWISLTWDGTYLTIDGYAIETDDGVRIEAGAVPAPGAIGLLGLAAGAAGLRRKRQA